MVNQITRKYLPKEALKLAKPSFVPEQKIPSLGGRVSAGPGLLDHLGRADSFSDENILRSLAATCQGPLPGVIDALALEVRGYGGGAGEEAVAWLRSVSRSWPRSSSRRGGRRRSWGRGGRRSCWRKERR